MNLDNEISISSEKGNKEGNFYSEDSQPLFSSEFASAFDSSASLMVVVDTYAYKILFANKAAKKIFPDLCVNNLCYKALRCQNTPCSSCPLNGSEDNFSGEIKLGNGSWYLAQYSFIIRKGHKLCVVNYTDINAQKKAEAALLERMAENNAVIEQSGKCVVRYSIKNRTAYFFNNCGKSFGLDSVVEHFPNEALKTRVISPESYDDMHYFFESISLGVPEGSVNAKLKLIDSQERWYHADYSLCFEGEEPNYCIISFFDNTETRERELAYEVWQTDMDKRRADCVFYIDANLTTDTIEGIECKSVYLIKEGVGDSLSALVSVGSKLNIYYKDSPDFAEFMGKNRLTSLYRLGVYSDSMDFRSTESGLHWLRAKVQMVKYPYSEDIKIYVLISNVDAEHKERERLIDMATCDSLTRLLNRETTMTRIREFLEGEGIDGNHALFMIDIDNFKSVNDTFGHQAGDNVVVGLASSLKSCFRSTDIIGRIGGDEFFAFMKNVNINDVKKRAKDVISALQMVYTFGSNRVELSASMGVSLYTNRKSLEKMYAEADAALYGAKEAGKNRYSIDGLAPDNDKDVFLESDNMNLSLRTLLNDIEIGVALYRSQGAFSPLKTVFCNDDFYTVLGGITADEYNDIYGKGFYEGLFPDDRDLLSAGIADSLKNKTPICMLLRLLGRNKIYYWVNLSARLLPNEHGGVDIYAIFTPLNHQTEMNTELAESRAKVIAAINRADMSFWQYNIVSGTAEVLFSDFRTVFLEDTMDDFAQTMIDKGFIAQESHDNFLALHEELKCGSRRVEKDIRFSDCYGGGWYRISYQIIGVFGGKPVTAIATARNIDELIALKQENRLFKSLGKLLSEKTIGVFALNLTKNLYINGVSEYKRLTERSYTKTADGFIETGSSLFENPEDYAKYYKAFSRASLLDAYAAGTDKVTLDYRFLLVDSVPVWLQACGEMSKNPETGDIELFFCIFNIDKRKKTEIACRKLFDTDYELLAIIDVKDGTVNQIASRYFNYNGYNYNEYLPFAVKRLVKPEDCEECIEALSMQNVIKKLAQTPIYSYTFRCEESKGVAEGYKQWRFSYLDNQKTTIIVSRTDITKVVSNETDELTGLLNRQGFYRQAKELLHAFPEIRNRIIRFDFDNFKNLNEALGSSMGDKVLRDLGKLISDKFTNCLSARIEADHFVCLYPCESCNPEVFLQILADWESNYPIDFKLSSHMGVFEIEDASLEINVMCDRALIALKSVKDSYTNKLAYYSTQLSITRQRQQALAEEMVSALANNEFVVYFQPIFDFVTKRIVGAEALVRWQHSALGLISPSEFIPLFEQNGFITSLDEYVFDKSCKYLSEIKRKFGNVPISVSVNVSRIDLYNSNLSANLSSIIRKYDLDINSIRIEITESAYTRNPDQLLDALHSLKNAGFFIEMDDFGSGYSSLNILKDMPVDVLKMDSRFLTQGVNSDRGSRIIAAVVKMSQEINISVIAEGVESLDQAEYLNTLGCIYMQGYHFGKPMPGEELEKLLNE